MYCYFARHEKISIIKNKPNGKRNKITNNIGINSNINFNIFWIMKARELTKQSITIEEIYESIKNVPKNHYKWFIPHFVYVSESVKTKLMEDGFELTIGDWDNVITNALIIKW